MNIIDFRNVNFKYPQSQNNCVDDVSFSIEKGSYTVIVGYNGSGKSTIAKILCGLEKQDSGFVEIEQNNKIGVVFQSPKDQIVSGIVFRDTSFGPQNLGLTPAEVELRTIESLNIVDMLDRAESSTSALSLGQNQKIALSGVLALRPEILVMDEAVSMLDPQSRNEILEFVKYWHKCGNTIIQITHDLDIVKEADNVICMEKGKVVFYGTKNAFLSEDKNISKLIGKPLPKTNKSLWKPKENEKSLKLENVTFEYSSKEKHGLKNISLQLYKGSLNAFTGASGAGKSTLFELCAGLLKPSAGTVYCDSYPSLAQQNATSALFEKFAVDDVAFGPKNKGLGGKELKERVQKAMELSAIPYEEYVEKTTFGLSGGEQRRLSIAGIIALNSEVIIFDEPTAGLDCITRVKVMQMLRVLAQEGKTVLFSTHRRDEADFADREISISDGIIIKDTYIDLNKQIHEEEKDTKTRVLSVYEANSILTNLRTISLSLSGTNNKNLTPIRKISSFIRILLFLFLFLFALSVKSINTCCLILCISIIYAKLCGFSLKQFLKNGVKILPFLLIFTIFQLIFHPAIQGEPHFTTWKFFFITPSKIKFCLISIVKTFSALGFISSFFVSTPEYDLLDGLQKLLKPLSIIKIPVQYFILIIEVIFRFIPLLVDEANGIIKTQVIRGGLGNVSGKMAKIKAMIPLIVPLIVQTIKRSEALASAITMRCFK